MPNACFRLMSASLCTALAIAACLAPARAQARFAIQGEQFLRDGRPHVIRSGEIHYPRVPREYWRDRLHKLKAMGLNTVTTYVFWSLHEPEPGQFDFSGNLDVAAFIRTAQDEGLDVIVRPGPYICTELDFGGFPAWLLRTPGLRVRSMDPRFLAASQRYLQRVAQELKPLRSSHGGPIVMAQVENEYGSYGNDHDYMQAIHGQIVDAGFDVPLFTSDGPDPRLLENGTLPGVTAVINFDGDVAGAKDAFKTFAAFRQGVPRMVGEYWAGWFDHWGKPHQTRSATTAADSVAWFLDNGISFNLYMAHGGTNFGFMAGANQGASTPYNADTTSYDYDAVVDEAGRLTPKFHAIRDAIARHLPAGERLPPVPADAVTVTLPRFQLTESVALGDALPMLSEPVASSLPRNMEALNQNYGLVLYRTRLDQAGGRLQVRDVRDYASVFVDGKPQGTLDRRLKQSELQVAAGGELELLVENMGRVNFDQPMATEYKGITHSVRLGDNELRGWTMYPLPLNDISRLRFAKAAKSGNDRVPRFWRGSFQVDAPGDTFLDMRGWGKGHVWVNGHHLGRYWKIGPQQALYLPAPWLKPGRNEVVVLDVEGGAGNRGLAGLRDPVYATAVQPAR